MPLPSGVCPPISVTSNVYADAAIASVLSFLADRTIGRAYGTVCRLSVCRLSSVVCPSVCTFCGETVRPSEKLSEGVNRKPGSKS